MQESMDNDIEAMGDISDFPEAIASELLMKYERCQTTWIHEHSSNVQEDMNNLRAEINTYKMRLGYDLTPKKAE